MAKHKILFLSDHPLVPSGVGTQAKYLIEKLLETGRYKFICLGGAIQHPDYTPQRVAPEKFGDDWLIVPVNGYGDKNIIRQLLIMEKPDAIFMFTDPRFFYWIWEIEDEIRAVCPLVYWHVWDNDPTPKYNMPFYESTDYVSCISLKTYGILQDLGYSKDRFNYIPHSIPEQLFKPLPEEENMKFKHDMFGAHRDKKFTLFWNNRNARRKQTGDVIATFAGLAKRVGKENVSLFMHTQTKDQEGQDVQAVAKCYGVEDSLIISEARVDSPMLNRIYNAVDCTINISSNEGHGLSTTESLFAGTPIVAHMTGGLQYQMGDWYRDVVDFRDQEKLTELAKKRWRNRDTNGFNWWGVPVFSASRSCTGSQQIPYIYDDRVNHEDVVDALEQVYNMGRSKRKELGLRARDWAIQNFNQDRMVADWDRVLWEQISNHKSGYRAVRVDTI
jgi:glycosyltransferase involved in cell wall biosynthesis